MEAFILIKFMKFFAFFIVLLCLTGCAKNNNVSVKDYASKMGQIVSSQSQYNLIINQDLPNGNFDYNCYIKGTKWRFEHKNKKTGDTGIGINNGKNQYMYNINKKNGHKTSFWECPANHLLDWYQSENIDRK